MRVRTGLRDELHTPWPFATVGPQSKIATTIPVNDSRTPRTAYRTASSFARYQNSTAGGLCTNSPAANRERFEQRGVRHAAAVDPAPRATRAAAAERAPVSNHGRRAGSLSKQVVVLYECTRHSRRVPRGTGVHARGRGRVGGRPGRAELGRRPLGLCGNCALVARAGGRPGLTQDVTHLSTETGEGGLRQGPRRRTQWGGTRSSS